MYPTRRDAGFPQSRPSCPIAVDSDPFLAARCNPYLSHRHAPGREPTRQTAGLPSIAAKRPIAADSFSYRLAPGCCFDTPGRRLPSIAAKLPAGDCSGPFSLFGQVLFSVCKVCHSLRYAYIRRRLTYVAWAQKNPHSLIQFSSTARYAWQDNEDKFISRRDVSG